MCIFCNINVANLSLFIQTDKQPPFFFDAKLQFLIQTCFESCTRVNLLTKLGKRPTFSCFNPLEASASVHKCYIQDCHDESLSDNWSIGAASPLWGLQHTRHRAHERVRRGVPR